MIKFDPNKKRKLGSPFDGNLIIDTDGSVKLKDGTQANEYLIDWMKHHEIKGPLIIAILPVTTLLSLESEALLYRSHSA